MKKSLLFLMFYWATSQLNAQNRALHFDGVDDYVEISNYTGLSGPKYITIETWIYVDNFNSSPCNVCAPVVWHQDDAYRFGTGNGKGIHFDISDGTSTQSFTISSGLNQNQWHHIAGTFDGNFMRIYLDGVLKDSSTAKFSALGYNSTSTPIWIGDPATGYGGIVEETRIWDYARSKKQIQDGMYKKFPQNEKGLLLQLSYEDGIPYKKNTNISSVNDDTPNGNDGKLNNFYLDDSTSNFVIGRSFCDSTVYGKATVTACDKYTFPSKKRFASKSGTYSDTIVSVNGCDSVITFTVTIKKSSAYNIKTVVCDSFESPINKGSHYYTSGKYQERTSNYLGCDSIITIFLTVTSKAETNFKYSACYSVSLKGPSGRTVTKSGKYYDTLKGWGGCDSILIHDVFIKQRSFAKRRLDFCRFVVCPTDKDVIYRSEGLYYDTISNYLGCDSIIEYEVKSTKSTGDVSVRSCGNYKSPSGEYTWNVSGKYRDTLIGGNYKACDSFINIDLTILKPTTVNLTEKGCGLYVTPLGKKVTKTGKISESVKSTLGCDSIIYSIDVTIVNVEIGLTRDWNTLNAKASGAGFQWLDCNQANAVINGETTSSYSPLGNGKFAVEVKQNGCTDTSACVVFAYTGIRDLAHISMQIVPNPSSGKFQIRLADVVQNAEIQVFNSAGQLIYTEFLGEFQDKDLKLILSSGIYSLKIQSNKGAYLGRLMID